MRRRRLTVTAIAIGLALSAPVGNASLETDCYFAGGYFGATYFADNYFDETCSPGDPPAPVTGDQDHKHLFRFGDGSLL